MIIFLLSASHNEVIRSDSYNKEANLTLPANKLISVEKCFLFICFTSFSLPLLFQVFHPFFKDFVRFFSTPPVSIVLSMVISQPFFPTLLAGSAILPVVSFSLNVAFKLFLQPLSSVGHGG